MNFGDLLNKYGVTWVERYLSYTPWVGRNGGKLTGVVAHTEGVPLTSAISGTSDRTLLHYFNGMMNLPASQRANAHGYITFSGVFELYIPIEHGSWGAGNDDDNVQTFQIETQDNGRWNNASTYTAAQYRAWAGVYCALVEWSQIHTNKATPILFERSRRGLRRHNEIVIGRACPGELDVDRILKEAKDLWSKTNSPKPQPDGLYKVFKAGKQLNAYKIKQNALNYYIDNGCDKVVYNNLDFTKEFVEQKNVLESKIEELNKAILSLEGNIVAKESEIATLKERVLTCENAKSALQEKLNYVSNQKSLLDIIKKLYERFFKKN